MINYTIQFLTTTLIGIMLILNLLPKLLGKEKMQFQLSAWRPGRYELADFAQNVQKWGAFDENNNPLPFKKITKDLWEVETKGCRWRLQLCIIFTPISWMLELVIWTNINSI